jgi:hypothetical protein
MVLTDGIIAEYGYAILYETDKPVAPTGYKVVIDGVEFVDSQWRTKYVIEPLNEYEIERLAIQVKSIRNSLLLDCDWTQLPDTDVDKHAWATYRQALRNLTKNPNWPFIVWPEQPST